MKTILIDPIKKSVEYIDYNGDYQLIYKIIGCETFSCPIMFDDEDALYIDDEGLFKDQKGGVMMGDFPYALLGKMIIIGTDNEGASRDVQNSLEYYINQITWLNEDQVETYKNKLGY